MQNFSIEKRNEITNKLRETRNSWSDKKKKSYFKKRSQITKEWHNSLSDEEKTKHFQKIFKNDSNFLSLLETRIARIFDSWNIEYTRQKFIKCHSYDFCLNNILIIEVQGDYWHANPKKYKKNDIISYPNKQKLLAEDVWKKDEEKKKIVIDKGYKILYIWEYDMNKMNDIELEIYVYNLILGLNE